MLRRLRRPWALGTAVVLVVVAGTALWWFVLHGKAAAASAPESTTQSVAASTTTLEKSVSGSGTIAPTVQEDVSFAVSGTVLSVDAAAGDTVEEGQQLATVDTLQLNADLLSAKATLATAEASLADLEDSDDGSDAADAQIAAASAQVDVAQAAVDTAQDAMDDATLVAPVAGLVTEVNLTVGEAVSGGGSSSMGGASTTGSTGSTGTSSSAQFVIVGTDSWDVDISVDDADVALIAVGDQAELTVDGADGTVFGTVSEIGLLSTSSSGVAAYPVTIAITGSPDGVHDGVSADVAIVYERRTDVLTVPSAAVRTVDGQSVVMQAGSDGSEVQTPVTVGETVGDVTEITSGLSEGDEVLVTVVTQTQQSDQSDQSGTDQRGQMPTDFPSGGFDPSQMQMPGGQQGGTNG
ncbi:efflux RND transporter periplasmic adaptor subunit [Actinotalea sp. M2MS4P-6]|uniref:efflux RND transporter periplasmic adaptor subunit n=1 Tax=Actinotalea sp. M2MS4P-6 TaxID=2983762 RepID=UPI0021E46C21|nr:efflux RND transporter periplasmic adaptor subunit [Actinotalea sp. M2MS4P-6]MCV2394913.1 efflux RND transporter periplasmic adaptor subunit [Actinotalea sp. M2MS4P-6]